VKLNAIRGSQRADQKLRTLASPAEEMIEFVTAMKLHVTFVARRGRNGLSRRKCCRRAAAFVA
jgi:hypothetical protein